MKNIDKLREIEKFRTVSGRIKLLKEFFQDKPDLTEYLDLEGSCFVVGMSMLSYFKEYGEYEKNGERYNLLAEFEKFIDSKI